MNDLIVSAELAIVVTKTVQAMRTMGDNSFDVVLGECLDVACGQFLEYEFVTHASSRFARAALFGAQHGEIDLGRLQQPYNAASYFLNAAIIGSRAADPIKYFKIKKSFN